MKHPKGVYLHGAGEPAGEDANKPNQITPKEGSPTPPQHGGSGQQEPGPLQPVIIRAGAGSEGTGEVPSAGTLGGVPFTPALKRRCVGTSTPGLGRRVLEGGDTSIHLPGARSLLEDPPRHSPSGLGGRVLFIKSHF
jgi:hypothetical protein